MKLSYDELLDGEYEFEDFEKFSGERRSMRDSGPKDKNKGKDIRMRRKERENMRAELENNQDIIDI